MTRKDYQLLAKVLSEYLDDGDNDLLNGIGGGEKIARDLAYRLKNDNPDFDYVRFLKACGLEN